MAFASIYVPDFMIQAVVRAEPALRHGAIALVDGTPPLESVVAVNEAAARAGIDLGISKSALAQFCTVETRHRSRAQEQAAQAALLDLGWSVSPRVEDTAPGAIVLDLAGLASLFSSEQKIAHRLAQGAASFGLRANVAVASNVEAALHAARGFPGITVIPPGEEAKRLGPLPVQVLSLPAEILEVLDRWGVRTCEALAALPVLPLSERLGQQGVRFQGWARGASVRSLIVAEPELCFREEMSLEYAVAELEPLSFLLGRLLDQLCARLVARSLSAGAVRLKFGLDAASERERFLSEDRRQTSAPNTYEKVLSLPVPMQDSKMLLKLLCLQLQANPPCAPIVAIELSADPARLRVTQRGLFLPSFPDPEKLELTIARLANLVGDGNVGSPQLMDTHRPGGFQMARFNPPRDAPQRRRTNGAGQAAAARFPKPATGFRVLRPSPPAHVEIRDAQPVRVSFGGLRGDVVAVSGPWRSSGEWWQEDAWQHDEWDVEIRFRSSSGRERRQDSFSPPAPRSGVYRIYYDSIRCAWFVRGMYD
jgi:protein ImuB